MLRDQWFVVCSCKIYFVHGAGPGGAGRKDGGHLAKGSVMSRRGPWLLISGSHGQEPRLVEGVVLPSHRPLQHFLDSVALYSSLQAPPHHPPTFTAGQLSFPVQLLYREGLETEVEGGGSELARALLSCTCHFSSRLSYTRQLALPTRFRLSGMKVNGGGGSSVAWTSGRGWEDRGHRDELGGTA